MKFRLSILRPPVDLWYWNEFRNGLASWFRVPFGPAQKTRQTLTVTFSQFQKMWPFANDFKQRQIIYRWKALFFPWVWIRDRYLKIRLHLARDNLQSFPFLHRNACWWYGHFCWSTTEGTIFKRNCAKHDGTKDCHKKWSLIGIWASFLSRFGTHLHHHQRLHFMANGASSSSFDMLWPQSSDACSLTGDRLLGSWMAIAKRKWEKDRDLER